MDFVFSSFPDQKYSLAQPQAIRTPRLVVFEQQLRHNITAMERLLAGAGKGYSLASLCPHVKTHKSAHITRLLMQAGVTFFKATPNELDMLIQAGAERMFIAYPLLPADADDLARIVRQHPDRQFFIQLARPEHVTWAEQAARRHKVRFHYFIDLNVGMQRTGLSPEQAWSFYASIPTEHFVFSGLHAYDGHIHQPDAADRRRECRRTMQLLQSACEPFRAAGVAVAMVVVGGTPSFLPDAEQYPELSWPGSVFFSPGTFIYFDSKYAELMPDTFYPAALILAQIMDQPADDLYTLNLGHKRWAVDQGPVDQFSVPGMKAVRWSEEHTVVQVAPEAECQLGDYVLIAPKHVCSTVNLYEYFTLIDATGEIRIESSPIEGRNR
jgi:D-serine deaminase-like pyridoxal phosphate-dependent protein